MWADGWSDQRTPSLISAGSNLLLQWKCTKGHIFNARPWELVSGKRGCNICSQDRTIAY